MCELGFRVCCVRKWVNFRRAKRLVVEKKVANNAEIDTACMRKVRRAGTVTDCEDIRDASAEVLIDSGTTGR
jgi:hypothetical protein